VFVVSLVCFLVYSGPSEEMFRECCGLICVVVHLMCVVCFGGVAFRGLSVSIDFLALFFLHRSVAFVVPVVIPLIRVGGGVQSVSNSRYPPSYTR